ncbi:PDZ domain-containing protein [Erysipelotrichaceae bacterium OttesenSCG-928-M19]|nr:PDZ domain-containing protein [Erysipelotrichaceae bacterium OttesenSCG-928-M19]
MKKNRKYLIFVIVFLIYSIGLYKIASNPTSIISTKTNDPYLARFIENYNTLKENWYYFTSPEEVLEKATNAMTLSNDKNDLYTEYIKPEDSKEYFASMESDFVGLGIQYIKGAEYPLISRIFTGSPAQKAKLQVGDSIKSIDNKSLKGLDAEAIKDAVLGKDGQKRNLVIIRNNKEIKTTVVLKELEFSVFYEIIDNNGYLLLNEFSKTTASEVESALKEFEAKNVDKVIIDLRNNPGGYLTTLEEVADLFLPANKVILKTKDKEGNINEYKTTDDKKYDNDYVLLVNHNSASAAEAFVACLNENLNIPIYGSTTYGKGIMQDFFEYSDGGYLKYTNAEWLTPKNNAINQKGIKPTTEVKDSVIFNAMDNVYNFDKDIKYNTVSANLIAYQKALRALGYDVDRVDGYYSKKTQLELTKFKKDYGLSKEVDLSKRVQNKIVERVFIEKDKTKNDHVLNQVLK